jgi:hypothetical protein
MEASPLIYEHVDVNTKWLAAKDIMINIIVPEMVT